MWNRSKKVPESDTADAKIGVGASVIDLPYEGTYGRCRNPGWGYTLIKLFP